MPVIDKATGSWMLPEATSESLLYVTNYSNVLVYSYPQGKLVGELKHFYSAAGECVDANGDVFVTNFKPVTVYEYAHGGTKPIAKFPTKKAGTLGCAINPVNGDLAISGLTSYVEIFKGAKGKPMILRDSGMQFGEFCTYDTSGDLFFDGLATGDKKQRLSELVSGSRSFTSLKLNVHIDPEASIQWANGYLAALSYVPFHGGKPEIFQFTIAGSQANRAGETPLGMPANEIVQYFINGTTVIVPNQLGTGKSDVLLYTYPAGGDPFLALTKRVTIARGAVVSPPYALK